MLGAEASEPYTLTGTGVNVCPSGLSALSSSDACATAAAALGLKYQNSGYRTDQPSGCAKVSGDDFRVFYNTHSGVARGDFQLVCVNAAAEIQTAPIVDGEDDDPELIISVWLALPSTLGLAIALAALILWWKPVGGGMSTRSILPVSSTPVSTPASSTSASSTTVSPAKQMKRFMLMEVLDILTENSGLVLVWAEGDLDFKDDYNLMKIVLVALNVISLVGFLIEIRLLYRPICTIEDKHMMWMKVFHMGVEDCWQFLLLLVIGLSQAYGTIGFWVLILGAVQSVGFLIVRVYDIVDS